MSDRLAGAVTIITGGARGTGAATARRFVEEGATVVIADVRDDLGTELASQLGPAASFEHLDVTDEEQWAAVVARTVERRGRLDVLVNNAAILHLGSLARTTRAAFDQVMAVNAAGVFLGIRAVTAPMRDGGGGSIVNVASIDAVYVAPSTGAYAASKFAVRGLTKVAALELGQFGIRVNAVCPEAGNPEMIKPFLEQLEPDSLRAIAPPPRPPLRRRPELADVANTIVFLASDESAFYSGTDFVLDGGTSAGMNIQVPEF